MLPDAVLAVWFAFVFVAEPIEHASHHRLVAVSAAINDGMTPAEVREMLGEPRAEYAKRGIIVTWWRGGPRPKQWMYGTNLNLDYLVAPRIPWLNPLPMNLRVSEYADEDLVIDWTVEDRVSSIKRPDFDVPDVAFGMLDSALFSRDFLRLFVFRQPLGLGNGR